MKTQKISAVLALSLVALNSAQALPVLNMSAAGNEVATIYPDHANAKLFYASPTVMVLARDESGKPQFSYMEYKKCMFCDTKAVVQVVMVAVNASDKYAAAIEEIRKKTTDAVFAGIPFVKSSVNFSGELGPLVESSDCHHLAGVVGSEQQCVFNLNARGRKVMRNMFRRGLALTMGLEYEVQGVTQKPDATYEERVLSFNIAGRIGSSELAKYPELFLDVRGRKIKLTAAALQHSDLQ